MTTRDPYSTPSADLTQATTHENFPLHPPRTVAAGQGVQWVMDGFQLFKQDALMWIAICVVGFLLSLALNKIPVVNVVASFFYAVWVGGLLIGCKAQHDREPLKIQHLFAGFQKPLLPLLGLSACLFAATLVVIGGVALAVGIAGLELFSAASFSDFSTGILLVLLIAVALALPLGMLSWFAPALIALHGVPVFEAMSLSFQACLKNILPTFIYGLVLLVLLVLAIIPLGLGLIVLVPVIYCSIFTSYKDIFVDE